MLSNRGSWPTPIMTSEKFDFKVISREMVRKCKFFFDPGMIKKYRLEPLLTFPKSVWPCCRFSQKPDSRAAPPPAETTKFFFTRYHIASALGVGAPSLPKAQWEKLPHIEIAFALSDDHRITQANRPFKFQIISRGYV